MKWIASEESKTKKEDPFGGIKPRDEFEFQKEKSEKTPEEKVPEKPKEENKETPKKENENEKWNEYEQVDSQEPYHQDYHRGRGSPYRRSRRGRGSYHKVYRGPGNKQYYADEGYEYENQVKKFNDILLGGSRIRTARKTFRRFTKD